MIGRKRKAAFILVLLFFISIIVNANIRYTSANGNELVIYSIGNNICDYITGTGNYFEHVRTFYKDNENRVAYCVQTSKNGPSANGTLGYVVGAASVSNNSNVINALTNIVCKGYPNSYGTYVVGGNISAPIYKTGLLINNTVYECTKEEANAVTAFAIHRQMLAIQQQGILGVEGNDNTLYEFRNGLSAKANLIEISSLLSNHTIGYNATVNLNWATIVNNEWEVSKEPTNTYIIKNNISYYSYNIIVTTNNCTISNLTIKEGDDFVTGAIIDSIDYKNINQYQMTVLVPNTIENMGKELGVNAFYKDIIKSSIIAGHTYLQDMIIAPVKSEISKSISTKIPLGSFKIIKKDETTKNNLNDFTFEVFEDSKCTKSIGKYTTNGDGSIKVSNLTKKEYYVKEVSGKSNYLLKDDIFKVLINTEKEYELIVYNKKAKGDISIHKKDKDNKGFIPIGNATLTGAIYGLYAKDDIYSLDGTNKLLYKKDSLVLKTIIDEQGKGYFKELDFGNYYIKEIEAPIGYNLSSEIIDVSLIPDNNKNVKLTFDVFDDVKKQSFQLIKINSDKAGEAKLLSNTGFSAWLKSDLKTDNNGNYIFDKELTVALCENGDKEMFTDEKGYACSIPLPYGEYIVKETTVPKGLEPVDNFIVTISEDNKEPQTWRILNDTSTKSMLKILKVDKDTGQIIKTKGFKFKVFDCNNDCYLEQKIYYPTEEVVSVFETDKNGVIIIPFEIPHGKYIIEEVGVPSEANYQLSTAKLEIEINNQSVLQESNNVYYYIINFPDEKIKGEVEINKVGVITSMSNATNTDATSISNATSTDVKTNEVVDDDNESKKTPPGAVEIPLKNVEFKVFAANDIFMEDYSVDELGNRIIKYKKDEFVGQIKTDKKGYGKLDNLPLGNYYILETSTNAGYKIDEEKHYFTLSKEKTKETLHIKNYLIDKTTKIKIIKKDSETQKPLANASFGIYSLEKVVDDKNNIIYTKNQLICSGISDKKGIINLELFLVKGQYYIKEIKAPDEYIISNKKYYFEILDTSKVNNIEVSFTNKREVGVLGKSTHKEEQETEQKIVEEKVVKTGDTFKDYYIIILTLTSCIMIIAIFYIVAKKKSSKNIKE